MKITLLTCKYPAVRFALYTTTLERTIELIRARQEYLLDGRVDLLDPRYRPNASLHPSATRHTTRAQRVTPQARNFLNRCSVFRLIYKYTLNGYFLYFVLCRCAIIYEISNYYYYCYYYCCSLAYFMDKFFPTQSRPFWLSMVIES